MSILKIRDPETGEFVPIPALRGEKGDTGATGAQGEKGDTGATGAQGPQGEKGEKGDTGATGPAGADGVSATHSWNGTILTITSASGTSSVDLKGEKGDPGEDAPQEAILYTEQSLTDEQKARARENIGAAAEGESAAMQTLTLTGAVSATYDGSTAVSVEIPVSGWGTVTMTTSLQVNGTVTIPASVAKLYNAFYIALRVPSTSTVYTTIVPTTMLSGTMYIVLPDGYKLAITKTASGPITIANLSTSAVALYTYGLV